MNNRLLEPYRLGDLELPNRIVMAPLTRTRAENPGHIPTALMSEYYAQRASAGLIISEGAWISEDGQGWYGAPGIYNELQGAAWASVTEAVHKKGGRIFAQLWHQGSISHRSFFADGRLPLAPSAVNPEQQVHINGGTVRTETPRAMMLVDIRQTALDYRDAAKIAKDAGFDGIQIQAGFLYLSNQFLNEQTNRRTDEYGGSVQNRARLLFEVLDAVLEIWPSQRVGVKTGPMTNELGLLQANASTLSTAEYVYERLNHYNLSHVFVMRQMADLSKTPISTLAGDAVIPHFRAIYSGTMILNVGISLAHARRLARQDAHVLVAFGREYIANPDLVERIKAGSALNEQKPSGYYGSSSVGYTDYPLLPAQDNADANVS